MAPQHSITARFGCYRTGRDYGWWWWLNASNGNGLASAGTSAEDCRLRAKAACALRGWKIEDNET